MALQIRGQCSIVKCYGESKSKPGTPLSVFVEFHTFEVRADMKVKFFLSIQVEGETRL